MTHHAALLGLTDEQCYTMYGEYTRVGCRPIHGPIIIMACSSRRYVGPIYTLPTPGLAFLSWPFRQSSVPLHAVSATACRRNR